MKSEKEEIAAAEPIKSQVLDEDMVTGKKLSLKTRFSKFFGKFYIGLSTTILFLLDLSGLYSNWAFVIQILGPLKEDSFEKV